MNIITHYADIKVQVKLRQAITLVSKGMDGNNTTRLNEPFNTSITRFRF